MISEKVNYKFVFIGIFLTYFIAQNAVALLRPEGIKYLTTLQIPIFVIPLIIIHFATTENNKFQSFKFIFKLKLKFDIAFIPCVLWILCGITLFQVGFDIVLQNTLPSSILDMYDKLLESYSVMSELAKLQNNSIQEFLIVSSCIAIIPGVCEELLFRGYLMQSIAIRNSKFFAICISAMIFAFIHIFPNAGIPIFIIGVFLGKLFYSSNSIMPPILLHFANNFLSFIAVNYFEETELNSKNIDLGLGIVFVVFSLIILLIAYIYLNYKENSNFKDYQIA